MARVYINEIPRDIIKIKLFDLKGYEYTPDTRWENIFGNPQNNKQLMELLLKFYTGEEIDISEYIKTINQDVLLTKEEYDNLEDIDNNISYFITD